MGKIMNQNTNKRGDGDRRSESDQRDDDRRGVARPDADDRRNDSQRRDGERRGG